MARTKLASDAQLVELREFGLSYPGAHLKSPWPGHKDLAVKDKTFAYLSPEGEAFSIGCKLPQSSSVALMLPFCTPAAYGLGKSGWVTATPPPGQPIPIEMFKAWIDESYRAQAPKKLVAQIAVAPPPSAPRKQPAANKSAKKSAKTPAKKPARKQR